MGEGIIGRQCASVSKGGRIVGASVSEPHTCGLNENVSIYIYIYIYVYMFIYLYIWYVRIPYMHSALFVRDAIFQQ